MTHVPAAALADQARIHLGEPGPLNTCLSNGIEKWTAELGLPTLGTTSVSEAVRRAKAGHHGYRYVDGTAGLARGHIGVWTHEALRSDTAEHVCVVDEVRGDLWRGIGSGTPSQHVARQPEGGGYNPRHALRGYIVAPTETVIVSAPPRPATPATPAGVYVVQRGDTLTRIAGRKKTTVRAILAANPPRADGRSADYRIARANLILVGQRIRIP